LTSALPAAFMFALEVPGMIGHHANGESRVGSLKSKNSQANSGIL
jgi:hypothetical protein